METQDRDDACEQVGGLGGGHAAASAGDLGEHRHGVVGGTGHDGDAHGEQHTAEQGLGEEGLELGSGAGAAEVQEDHVAGEGERDQRGEQVDVGTEDRVELDGAQ